MITAAPSASGTDGIDHTILALEITWDGQVFPLTTVELGDHRRVGDFYLPSDLLDLLDGEQGAVTDWSANPAPQGSVRLAPMTYFPRPLNGMAKRIAETFSLRCPNWQGSVMVVGHHDGADVPLSEATAIEVRELVRSLTVPAVELCGTTWHTCRLDPDALKGTGMQVLSSELDGCPVQLWLEPGDDDLMTHDPAASADTLVVKTVVAELFGSGLTSHRPVVITGRLGGDSQDITGVTAAGIRAATAVGLL